LTPKLGVDSSAGEQVDVGAAFDDSALVHDQVAFDR